MSLIDIFLKDIEKILFFCHAYFYKVIRIFLQVKKYSLRVSMGLRPILTLHSAPLPL
jgi:hypothetical protein